MDRTKQAQPPHPVEAQNRTRYVMRMIQFLDSHLGPGGYDHTTLAALTAQDWNRLAQLADEVPPSKATISQIVGFIHGRAVGQGKTLLKDVAA